MQLSATTARAQCVHDDMRTSALAAQECQCNHAALTVLTRYTLCLYCHTGARLGYCAGYNAAATTPAVTAAAAAVTTLALQAVNHTLSTSALFTSGVTVAAAVSAVLAVAVPAVVAVAVQYTSPPTRGYDCAAATADTAQLEPVMMKTSSNCKQERIAQEQHEADAHCSSMCVACAAVVTVRRSATAATTANATVTTVLLLQLLLDVLLLLYNMSAPVSIACYSMLAYARLERALRFLAK
eukprot:9082-Heterococcus_DN1.PRE.4